MLANYVTLLRSVRDDLRAFADSHPADPSDPYRVERMFNLKGKIGTIGYLADLYETRGAAHFDEYFDSGYPSWFSSEVDRIERERADGFADEFEALMFATSVLRRVGDFELMYASNGSN